MDEKHELVSAVKRLAGDLGRSPTKGEFVLATPGATYRINKHFGTFAVLLQAAGLETYDERRSGGARRITNAVFEVPIEQHLEEYKPKPVTERKAWPTIAGISDAHRPFHCERVINRFIEYVGDEKPQYVIENGDGRDFLAHSRFPRSHNLFTPREENALARKQHVKFWEDVMRASPKSERILMLGNHCVRPMRRTLESYPEAEDWIAEAMRREFQFEGVQTVMDPREEYRVGNIIVHHGFKGKLGDHRDYFRENCITGHSHKGGVVWRTMASGECIFELNCGYAADPFSQGLSYTPSRIVEWTHGFGVVNKYGPQFVSV